MDQIKIGKFIAALRKDKGLTQEQLGEKLGVTNKTISRWENGNYMPDVEMLSLLSKEFGETKVFCKKATKAAEIRKAENPDKSKVFGVFAGVPGGIRTHGLSLRSSPCICKPITK